MMAHNTLKAVRLAILIARGVPGKKLWKETIKQPLRGWMQTQKQVTVWMLNGKDVSHTVQLMLEKGELERKEFTEETSLALITDAGYARLAAHYNFTIPTEETT